MKLAEALQERADLNRRIEQLNSRLYRNSKVQQEETLKRIRRADFGAGRLHCAAGVPDRKDKYMQLYHKTPDGKSITELIAKRDCSENKNRCLSRSCGQCKQLVRSRDPFRNCDFEHRGRSRASKSRSMQCPVSCAAPII